LTHFWLFLLKLRILWYLYKITDFFEDTIK
jgi:hypothetical protein